jgi:hypothetical protein
MLLVGCRERIAEEAAHLDVGEIVSTAAGVDGVSFVIRRTYEGGATGDTLYEAWICRHSLSDCQRAAIIDVHDGPAPSWRATAGGAALLISPTDAVWNYKNVVYGNADKLLRLTIVDGG